MGRRVAPTFGRSLSRRGRGRGCIVGTTPLTALSGDRLVAVWFDYGNLASATRRTRQRFAARGCPGAMGGRPEACRHAADDASLNDLGTVVAFSSWAAHSRDGVSTNTPSRWRHACHYPSRPADTPGRHGAGLHRLRHQTLAICALGTGRNRKITHHLLMSWRSSSPPNVSRGPARQQKLVGDLERRKDDLSKRPDVVVRFNAIESGTPTAKQSRIRSSPPSTSSQGRWRKCVELGLAVLGGHRAP